jgi:asparagine synthase (glutamine-hydrolysing)
MSIAKFIPGKINQWQHHKTDDLDIWIAGYDSLLILKKFIDNINSYKYINKKLIKTLLKSINHHFGIIIITEHWAFAAADCARSYPIFWKNNNSQVLISPQANSIYNMSPSKIDKSQLLAFQMSGYTIGNSTLWKTIKSVGPGELIIFKDNHNITENYFTYDPWINSKNSFKTLKIKLKLQIKEMILRLIEQANGKTIIIPLSAGLDSRLIASGLKEHKYYKVKCFSYGLKNNFESKASEIIAKKLGYEWKFVKTDIKIAKKFFASTQYDEFINISNDGCATIGIQDIYPIHILVNEGYITKNDIIVNGNSGDFISGGHIPKNSLMWKPKTNINLMLKDIFNNYIEKHYSLWEGLLNKKNKNIIKREIKKEIQKIPLDFKKVNMSHGILEFIEYQNRQCKYVVNFQRVYDYYDLKWLLPLWDKSFMEFWSKVPVEYKIEQNLYKKALRELNMGLVWTKEFDYKYNIHSKWIKALRFVFKLFFILQGKKKWHQFDRKYFSYWTDNICGQAILPYKKIITNKYGARHFVSWHTLVCEYKNLKSNWQKLKF